MPMNQLYAELQWLPRAPEEFSARLKVLGNAAGPLGREIQALALHALELNQLTKLARAIGKVRAEADSGGKSLDPLAPFRLAVLSNSTIDMIVPALVGKMCIRDSLQSEDVFHPDGTPYGVREIENIRKLTGVKQAIHARSLVCRCGKLSGILGQSHP